MCKNTEIREELVQLNERIRELEQKIAYFKGVLSGLLICMTILVFILRVFYKGSLQQNQFINHSGLLSYNQQF